MNNPLRTMLTLVFLSELQKELENIFIECLVWMKQIKEDPVHKKIMQTKDALNKTMTLIQI
jgi:hypothetical protein